MVRFSWFSFVISKKCTTTIFQYNVLSSTILFLVPSVPPGNITAYNTSSRSIMVRWSDIPVSESNGNLTNFLVLYAKNHTSEYTETILDSKSFHAELKNLEIFNPYKIRVVARNRRGEGVPSLPFVVWTEMEGTKEMIFQYPNSNLWIHFRSFPFQFRMQHHKFSPPIISVLQVCTYNGWLFLKKIIWEYCWDTSWNID